MLTTSYRTSHGMRSLAALAVVGILLSGCVSTGNVDPAADVDVPNAPIYHGPWAKLDKATLRPGVQVYTPIGGGQAECTSNFLFRTPDNATLFLGVAAHCFGETPDTIVPVGTFVQVGSVGRAGTIYYNGWAKGIVGGNDFGLVKLSNSVIVRARVNPTVFSWGGPTGILDQATVQPGTQVITYGHSLQRPPNDPTNQREGHIYQITNDHQAMVMTNYPGIHGDSGSGLMDTQGRALGVLSTKLGQQSVDPWKEKDEPTVNYYVDLAENLALAQRSDPTLQGLEIVTAPLLAKPDLPVSLPGPVPPIPP